MEKGELGAGNSRKEGSRRRGREGTEEREEEREGKRREDSKLG